MEHLDLDFMSEIYTPLEEAKEEIWRRWNDKELQQEVLEFLGEVPEALSKEPRAFLPRHVITPNMELLHFLNLADRINLNPIGVEYLDDKFCTINIDKRGLAKLVFIDGESKNGKTLFSYVTVIDCIYYDGKKLNELKTYWKENFVDFHHRMLFMVTPNIELFDVSYWYKSNGGTAENYYEKLLSLFICYGVLFESFVTNKEEEKFTNKVVYPSFEKVEKLFGLKPLIVPLIPEDRITDIYWWCYPDCIRKEVEDSLNGHRRK